MIFLQLSTSGKIKDKVSPQITRELWKVALLPFLRALNIQQPLIIPDPATYSNAMPAYPGE